jgi:hypothetical protein
VQLPGGVFLDDEDEGPFAGRLLVSSGFWSAFKISSSAIILKHQFYYNPSVKVMTTRV